MQREFRWVHEQFEAVYNRFNTLTIAVDAFAKQTETCVQEMLVLGHKVDRHEQWILKVAKATDVKLSA